MNPDSEFQLTLPSNSSTEFFPTNKASDFTTKLPTPIALEGEWELALIDIQYPHNWYNVPEDVGILFFLEPVDESILDTFGELSLASLSRNLKYIASHAAEIKTTEAITPKKGHFLAIHVPKGYYDNAAEIITIINQELELTFRVDDEERKKLLKGAFFKYSYKSNLRKTTFDANHTFPKPKIICKNKQIKKILDDMGFEPASKEDKLGENKPVVDSITSIYVYSDQTKYQTVGDSQVPLIGVFPVQGKDGDQLYWNFNPPYYIPVSCSTMASINIRLCDDHGDDVPFQKEEKVVVRLHFRRRRAFL